ncbi:hypothetical protein EGW08_016560, partial [Elysia chlorotica]
MADTGSVVKPGLSSTRPTSPDNAGPIIEESQESEEYQQDLQVVLGTAFGVIAVVGLIALGLLLYRLYRVRSGSLSYVAHKSEGYPPQPTVLMLYAQDCPIHERMVAALASFLMEACGCVVSLDLLEEAELAQRGLEDWLIDRLQEADYILTVCSLGARLRCSKKHLRFQKCLSGAITDYFAIAVDYVAEKMRVEQQKGMGLAKFINVYFDYSARSDIPPQLEMAAHYCLMRELKQLRQHLMGEEGITLVGDGSEKSEEGDNSHCDILQTETGMLLRATLEQAKSFFQENPTWMQE